MKAAKILAMCGMAVLLGVGGCATVPEPGESGEMAVTDARLTSEILRRLRDDPVTAPHAFGVFVRDGVVTIEGSVAGGYVHTRAIAIVRSTPGVKNVLNTLAPR
ncbi:MAG: BON domain-containing protein [Verrucomicrobia bacterium]|nr:BON domain-containing protein [Verrucomicrobiota bacterium]MBU1910768.1 BON domain-containing protein [Verrucomicrobiota bacterium]